MDDVIYFEFNDWADEYFPPEEPYSSWIIGEEENNYYINFRDEDWIKVNNLVVVESIVDMSLNYCVTARRDWVEKNCPNLLTKYSKFIVPPEDGEPPTGKFGCPFLELTDENIGFHEAIDERDGQGMFYYKVN